jgi:hypothetical protein
LLLNSHSNSKLLGVVSITVTSKEGHILKTCKPNTIIIDSTRLILAQMIPSSLIGSLSSIPKAGRPDILLSSQGPSNANAIGYIKLGYTTLDSAPDDAIALNTDTDMISGTTSVLKLQAMEISSNSLNFRVSVGVTSLTANRKYYEAALYTVGQGNELVPESPDTSTMLMFAHQVHSLISAPEGATITYDWTITIPE